MTTQVYHLSAGSVPQHPITHDDVDLLVEWLIAAGIDDLARELEPASAEYLCRKYLAMDFWTAFYALAPEDEAA